MGSKRNKPAPIVYVKISRTVQKKLLALISELDKVKGDKVSTHTQLSIIFLFTTSELTANRNEKHNTMYYGSEEMKYLCKSLKRHVQDIYAKSYNQQSTPGYLS